MSSTKSTYSNPLDTLWFFCFIICNCLLMTDMYTAFYVKRQLYYQITTHSYTFSDVITQLSSKERKLDRWGLQSKHDKTQKAVLLNINLKNPSTSIHEQHISLMSLNYYTDEKELGNNLISFHNNKERNKFPYLKHSWFLLIFKSVPMGKKLNKGTYFPSTPILFCIAVPLHKHMHLNKWFSTPYWDNKQA